MPKTRLVKTRISRRVDKYLAKSGLTRLALSAKLDIHHQTLYSIETGRHFGDTGAKLVKFLEKKGC